MSDTKIREIADKADMIIRGYAFTREDALIRILNLNDRESSMVITSDGTMVETNMDEIEQALVLDIWQKDSKYMEE
ncbi:MAG: hypothetical protein II634_03270 [Lachnospiraceae bacterium]|nr:hypothetical protein [Lachnospiraceae bacterium]